MSVNNMRKFIGEIQEEDMKLIEQAAEIQRSPRLAIIRKGAVLYAIKIIQEKENATNN